MDGKPPAPRLTPINTHRSLRSLLTLVSGSVSQSRLRVPLNAARCVISVLGIKLWLCSNRPRCVAICVAVDFSTACMARLEGQANPPPSAPDPPTKHIFGIFPNYGTSPSLSPYVPISSKEKFKIASEDALDPGGIVVAAAAGGFAQLLNSNRVFGQEVSGYGRYFAAAYGNHVIGDFMTEGVYPCLLHQDPRYFRKSSGSAGSRLGYAVSREFWTQTDAGGTAFNYSRVLGTTSTVAISSLYYAHHRMHPSPLMRLASSWAQPWRPTSSRSSGLISCEKYRESISANPSLLAGRLGDIAFAGEV